MGSRRGRADQHGLKPLNRLQTDTVDVIFLEMHSAPSLPARRAPRDLRIEPAASMPVHFYRYLYEVIGQDYMWVDRARLVDLQLNRIIHHADNEVDVLYLNGAPVGFAEMCYRHYPDVELVHFGLIPEATGCGFGRYFLTETVTRIWSRCPNRLHVQTSTLDHPAALTLYRKCGFRPFQKVVTPTAELV